MMIASPYLGWAFFTIPFFIFEVILFYSHFALEPDIAFGFTKNIIFTLGFGFPFSALEYIHKLDVYALNFIKLCI